MRANILQLLRKEQREFLSGEEISKILSVSRTAVWKHIQALKQEGYDIEAHSRLGYRLRQIPDLLLPEEIRPRLTTGILGKEIHYFAEIGSTNNEAKKLAIEGSPEGTIVVAESQHTGRGRVSRGWFAPAGKGIWLSVILRPPFGPQDAAKCTLMAAVAANKAFEAVAKVRCGIKWPNDILYQGKKLVGILTEMSAEIDAINYVVIGIGVNVNIAEADFPDELKNIATSLSIAAGRQIARVELLAALLAELEQAYVWAVRHGFSAILESWRKFSVTLGLEVDVYSIDRSFSGTAVDIDSDGALLVKLADGNIEKVLAGDVSIRAKQQGGEC